MAGKRTPFGRYGGALRDIQPSDLVAVPAKDALAAAGVKPEAVDTVNVGMVNVVSECKWMYLLMHTEEHMR